MGITENLIDEARLAINKVPLKGPEKIAPGTSTAKEKIVDLSPEERLRVREMLKKLRGSSSVR